MPGLCPLVYAYATSHPIARGLDDTRMTFFRGARSFRLRKPEIDDRLVAVALASLRSWIEPDLGALGRSTPPVRFLTSATILAPSASISWSVMVFSRGCNVTAIATADADTVTVRGKDLCSELIGKVDFADYFYFLVTGGMPTPQQRLMTNAVLVAIAEHGLVPSVQAARMTLAAAPEAVQGAVAAGLLGDGSVVAGSSESAGRYLAGLLAEAAASSWTMLVMPVLIGWLAGTICTVARPCFSSRCAVASSKGRPMMIKPSTRWVRARFVR